MDKLLDNLLPLLGLALFAAISAWIKKHTTEGGSAPPPTSPSTPPRTGAEPPPAPRALDWEEELRRLLEGEETPAAPRPVSLPMTQAPAPPVMAPSAPSPPVMAPRGSRPATILAPAPPPVRAPDYKPAQPSLVAVEMPAVEAQFAQTAAAEEMARGLGMQADEGLRASLAQAKLPASCAARYASLEGRQAIEFLRQPQTLRQAMIVSQILGPPKGLE